MAVDFEQLRNFQSANFEQTNEQTNVRTPRPDKVIEWALIEIAILLTGIRSSLNTIAHKP